MFLSKLLVASGGNICFFLLMASLLNCQSAKSDQIGPLHLYEYMHDLRFLWIRDVLLVFEKHRAASAAGARRRERVESLHHRNTELHTSCVCLNWIAHHGVFLHWIAHHVVGVCTVLCKRVPHYKELHMTHCMQANTVFCTFVYSLLFTSHTACGRILSEILHFTLLESTAPGGVCCLVCSSDCVSNTVCSLASTRSCTKNCTHSRASAGKAWCAGCTAVFCRLCYSAHSVQST